MAKSLQSQQKDKRQLAAEDLYFRGWTLRDIAVACGISEKSAQSWKRAFEWDQRLAARENTMHRIQEDTQFAIAYNLQCARRKAELEMQKAETEDGYIPKPIDKGDVDALQKLSATLRVVWKPDDYALTVTALKDYLQWLQARNLELAKNTAEYMTDYLKHKSKELS